MFKKRSTYRSHFEIRDRFSHEEPDINVMDRDEEPSSEELKLAHSQELPVSTSLKDKNITNAPRKETTQPKALAANQQNQILSALDMLGARLVKSESERETMRSLLSEARDAQDRFENKMALERKSLQEKLKSLENKNNIPQETLDKLDSYDEAFKKSAAENNQRDQRQARIEDRLKDSTLAISKIQRRFDTEQEKQARILRRLERVENIAAEAQQALEAKALVLLTDKKMALESHQPYLDATGETPTLNQDKSNTKTIKSFFANDNQAIQNVAFALIIFASLGLGWISNSMIDTHPPSYGQIATFENAKKIQLSANTETRRVDESLIENTPPPFRPSFTDDWDAFNADYDLMLLTELDNVQKPLSAIENAPIDMNQTPPSTDTKFAMDRDLTLTGDIKQLEDKAFSGIPEAQHDLAAIYTAGSHDVQQSYERAAYWFRQAADQNIANAGYNLGVLNHQGLGMKQNMDKALDWYRRAAQLGHPEAQYNLGIAYIEGIGTRYNPNMAAAFFQQAALAGIPEAAYNLGLVLENGLLGEMRPEKALQWYRAASDKGSVEAQQALANLAEQMNVTIDQAGLLENGQTLADFIALSTTHTNQNDLNAITPAAGNTAVDPIIKEAINLGHLLPTNNQMTIAQIQEQLRKMRYYTGPQDGVVGAKTVQAIKDFETAQQIEITGKATPELLSYMLSINTL